MLKGIQGSWFSSIYGYSYWYHSILCQWGCKQEGGRVLCRGVAWATSLEPFRMSVRASALFSSHQLHIAGQSYR